MSFVWNLDVQEISVSCNKRTLTLKNNATIEFNTPYCNTIIPLSDISRINIIAPKLFSRGVIGLYDKKGLGMEDEEKFPIATEIVKRQEKQFNQFVAVMKANGIDIRVVG